MDRPKDIKQLRSFLGAVTYNRNMWPHRSHLLSPLTNITDNTKYERNSECEHAFQQMKALLSTDVLLAYPNHNIPFQVYTDASDYQLGAVIIQNGRPVACWSRKLSPAQRNYTKMEKEHLAVVLCLQEFRTMLLGADIHIYTDHKNLTFRTLNPQRVLRWRLFLEDYHPQFHYIKRKDNVLADCFSRLPHLAPALEGKSSPHKGELIAFDKLPSQNERDELDEAFYFMDSYLMFNMEPSSTNVNVKQDCHFIQCKEQFMDKEIYEFFLNHPPLERMRNPITIQNIQTHQFEDMELNRMHQTHPDKYPVKMIQNRPLLCYNPNNDNQGGNWKIALPSTLLDDVIHWYHVMLGHCGHNRLYDTIRMNFAAPGLYFKCEKYHCDNCQRNKLTGPGYGMLPARNAPLTPWSEVMVDLVGPWKVKVQNQNEDLLFYALTCIDHVSNLVEMVRLQNKTAAHVSQQFENCRLNR